MNRFQARRDPARAGREKKRAPQKSQSAGTPFNTLQAITIFTAEKRVSPSSFV
jgi:hypothetical protein